MDIDLDLIELGNGNIDIFAKDENRNPFLANCSLPFGPPPVLPNVTTQLEEFLTRPDQLPIHDFERAQKHWPRKAKPEELFNINLCPLGTELHVERDPATGKLTGFSEVKCSSSIGTSKNSLSMQRLPGRPTESVRGSSTNYPFLPGWMNDSSINEIESIVLADNINFDSDLAVVPPGFSCGMKFDENEREQVEEDEKIDAEERNVINLAAAWKGDSFLDEVFKEVQPTTKPADSSIIEKITEEIESQAEELEKVLPVEEVLKISDSTKVYEKKPDVNVWAEKVNARSKVPDFYKKIPNMAHTWKFELDPFQQHAVFRLERNESVFVAAHTSAGKTVVAEYAIALCQKHRTRAIYTSPIKALSNQKFRDFKNTFEDVGILTGDTQINDKAACLVMTTEILRSMLYRGADTIRDLEWVIFDEVHYINDSERGVVWEEVLIMLPAQVRIVMLSATVPNVMEFAEWVGRTRQSKMFVISTDKRPVPLEHYLYIGSAGGKNKDGTFLIVDQDGTFISRKYMEAIDTKKDRKGKSGNRGGKGQTHSYVTPQQAKTIWLNLVKYLERTDQLPVVAFVFSRKNCDTMADLMSSQDLLTQTEKSRTEICLRESLARLKVCDRSLPQITRLKGLLKKGIGIHHSGILPIMKEVVEILFQDGLVKLLFATETFAMGVNMPARTVVFDTTRKHDGKGWRELLPSEYIQMAGRAGRRGKDKTGTVIILCKADIPERNDLEKMMLGKPTKLESKFRVTYTMMLNWLKIERFQPRNMLQRSFSELAGERIRDDANMKIKDLLEIKDKMSQVSCQLCQSDLNNFCKTANEYLDLKASLYHHCASTIFTTSRIIVVNHKKQGNTIAVVLKLNPNSESVKVLCLTDPVDEEDFFLSSAAMRPPFSSEPDQTAKTDEDADWLPLMALVKKKLYLPEKTPSHAVVDVPLANVAGVTKKTLKVESDKIVEDWTKRQKPRFRSDLPERCCSMPTRSLVKLTEENPDGFGSINYVKDLNLRDIDLADAIDHLKRLESNLATFQCVECVNFETHLQQGIKIAKLSQELDQLQYLLSDESLTMMGQYKARLNVMEVMNYIDASHIVQLKGKVACDISNHELMVTELILRDVLSPLKSEEIAAILSCLVFQQKVDISETVKHLPVTLNKAMGEIMGIAKEIDDVQKDYRVEDISDVYSDQLSFGLVEVVYEWAKQTPFAEIAAMSDVQEGIIVRCIQRLDEVLRDIKRTANSVIGNPTLSQKMEETSTCIKRDIVFAASLYTQ